MPDPYVVALGRISGDSLVPNLARQGIDLTFRNRSTDLDLLYLDVNTRKIGINTDAPVYELDVHTSIKVDDLIVTNQTTLGNIRLVAPDIITTIVGPIDIYQPGSDLWHDRLITSGLEFDDNKISSFSNQNIVIDPNGTGTVQLYASTNITGDVDVSGNIRMDGDLKSLGTVTIGDTIFDTATFTPDFSQSIIPGNDLAYDLGKVDKQWAFVHVPDWTHIENIIPLSATVSTQLLINGVNNKISAIQSNENVSLIPDSGITYIEQLKWQENTITNLLDTPITLASTGTGYIQFMGNNAIVIPAGDDISRRLTPELGETRWNTDRQYLESFNGTEWTISTGGGEVVTVPLMEDFGNIWSLILG